MNILVSVIMSVCMLIVTLYGQTVDISAALVRNDTRTDADSVTMPMPGGSDPWFIEHEGMYYYCYSIGNGVAVRKSDRVSTLMDGEETIAYRTPGGTDHSHEYWAPELHFINGKWYIYVAADAGDNASHRMFVFSSDTPDGEFEFIGKISDSSDNWAIDGTVLQLENELYFIWSGWSDKENTDKQNLYIAHMSDPARIDSERVMISSPDRYWEKKTAAINEGPEVLKKGDETYIIYSASASWTDDYCLGMLKLTGKDALRSDCWTKCPVPVLSKTKTVFGPGHCSFLMNEGKDGGYIIYHANSESGSGWNGRQVRIQPFTFINNIPVFGKPLNNGTTVKTGDTL